MAGGRRKGVGAARGAAAFVGADAIEPSAAVAARVCETAHDVRLTGDGADDAVRLEQGESSERLPTPSPAHFMSRRFFFSKRAKARPLPLGIGSARTRAERPVHFGLALCNLRQRWAADEQNSPMKRRPGRSGVRPAQLETAARRRMEARGGEGAVAPAVERSLAEQKWRRLTPLAITAPDMALPLDPNVAPGRLPCGLRYFIKRNGRPERRVALRLAVRVGSVLEDDAERGLAHVLEHLGFRATANYDRYELVAFFESIGAAFGACQNAYTAFDETVFMVQVPTDRPDPLRKALGVLHEWACRIRISEEDVRAERSVVLEEWRAGRTSANRAVEDYWATLTAGSAYERRMPIGIESVIRGASAESIRDFYSRWYRLTQMAVIVVGDVTPDDVIKLLTDEFSCEPPLSESGAASVEAVLAPLPIRHVPPHEIPRISTFVDDEASASEVCRDIRRDCRAEIVSLRLPRRDRSAETTAKVARCKALVQPGRCSSSVRRRARHRCRRPPRRCAGTS